MPDNVTVGVMAFGEASRVAGLIAFLGLCVGVHAAETDRAVRDLCGKSVAMLGESPLHGFGKTLEFKVELVQRLVNECHFNAFFIESGAYDFLNVQRRLKSGQEVTEPMLAAAIGGLWATREVQPLIPFLLEKAKAGSVVLGGLDDQLGRGTWAQREMPADLAGHLAGGEKSRCLAILQRHLLWQYGSDSPYGAQDKALILECLDRVDGSEYDAAMVDNMKRLLARDFRADAGAGADSRVRDGNDRDRSMYSNFRWLMARLPAQSKVIVWAATTHAAKELSGVSGAEGAVSFGSYVRREFGNRAFALGFSAYSGSYAMTGQPVRQLSAAPDDSMEARTVAGGESYVSLSELRKMGAIAGRALGAGFKRARRDEVVDGMVVFREERPPEFVRR
jgi:erythromycin esterase-like protein